MVNSIRIQKDSVYGIWYIRIQYMVRIRLYGFNMV